MKHYNNLSKKIRKEIKKLQSLNELKGLIRDTEERILPTERESNKEYFARIANSMSVWNYTACISPETQQEILFRHQRFGVKNTITFFHVPRRDCGAF